MAYKLKLVKMDPPEILDEKKPQAVAISVFACTLHSRQTYNFVITIEEHFIHDIFVKNVQLVVRTSTILNFSVSSGMVKMHMFSLFGVSVKHIH